jgi:hypothetical protein
VDTDLCEERESCGKIGHADGATNIPLVIVPVVAGNRICLKACWAMVLTPQLR